jgi:hypothetical protein
MTKGRAAASVLNGQVGDKKSAGYAGAAARSGQIDEPSHFLVPLSHGVDLIRKMGPMRDNGSPRADGQFSTWGWGRLIADSGRQACWRQTHIATAQASDG